MRYNGVKYVLLMAFLFLYTKAFNAIKPTRAGGEGRTTSLNIIKLELLPFYCFDQLDSNILTIVLLVTFPRIDSFNVYVNFS